MIGLISLNSVCVNVQSKRQEYDGREYLIVPIVALVEGVHNDLYYPASEIAKTYKAWNGVPIPIDHPRDENGNPISCNTPELIEEHTVGRFYNVFIEGEKLKGEGWIDVEKAQRISPAVLDIVAANGQLEVSTSLWSDFVSGSGSWQDESYTASVYNIVPDHLALLPGGIGACSWADGCGVRINKKEGGEELEVKEEINLLADEGVRKDKNRLFSVLATLGKKLGFRAHEVSHDDIREKLQGIVDGFDSPSTPTTPVYHYVRDVFDDYFIYEVRTGGSSPKLFKQEFEVDDEKVELKGSSQEVVEETEYVTVDEVTNNKKEDVKGMDGKKCCEEKIDALIANESTRFVEDDRKWLEEMPEDQIDKLTPVEPDPGVLKALEAKAEEVRLANAIDPKGGDPVTVDQYIADAPSEIGKVLTSSVEMFKKRKADLVNVVLVNEHNTFTKEDLEGMDISQLEKIRALAGIVTPSYEGSGGGPGGRPKELNRNEKQEDGSGIPDAPEMLWNQDGSIDRAHLQ